MKRLVIWWTLAAIALWLFWTGIATKVIHPVRTYDVIDSIKIQMPKGY